MTEEGRTTKAKKKASKTTQRQQFLDKEHDYNQSAVSYNEAKHTHESVKAAVDRHLLEQSLAMHSPKVNYTLEEFKSTYKVQKKEEHIRARALLQAEEDFIKKQDDWVNECMKLIKDEHQSWLENSKIINPKGDSDNAAENKIHDLDSLFGLGADEVVYDKSKPAIGEGSYSWVYEGFCRGVPVAIKLLKAHPSDAEPVLGPIKQEMSLLRDLSHENILKFYGFVYGAEEIMLITELARNGSIAGMIVNQKATLSWVMAVEIMKQIVSGMVYMHARSVYHLDLKPENLLLTENLDVKICDFGLSIRFKQENDQQNYRSTLVYMPPECWRQNPELSKADIYAFGITIWELFLRKRYFDNCEPDPRNEAAFQLACRNGLRPKTPEAIPPSLAELWESCWHEDPEKRPAFQDIPQSCRYERILAEAIDNGKGSLSKFLGVVMAKKTGDFIDWNVFVDIYCEFFDHNRDRDKDEFLALSAFFHVDRQLQVSFPSIHSFAHLFTPLLGAKEKPSSTLSEVLSLMKQPWFWGIMTSEEAAEKLQTGKKGDFLVRVSGEGNTYSISKISNQKTVEHVRLGIDEIQNSGKNLITFINHKDYRKKNNLKTPAQGKEELFSAVDPGLYTYVPSRTTTTTTTTTAAASGESSLIKKKDK